MYQYCSEADYNVIAMTDLSIRSSSITGHNMAALRVSPPCICIGIHLV